MIKRRCLLIALLTLVAYGIFAAERTKCQEVKLQVQRLPDLNVPRGGHQAFFVNDEMVVVGGHTSGFVPTATAEYYRDGQWHLMETVYKHDQGFALPLKNGKVLIAGGHELDLGSAISSRWSYTTLFPTTSKAMAVWTRNGAGPSAWSWTAARSS